MRQRKKYSLKVSNLYEKNSLNSVGLSKAILNRYFAKAVEIILENMPEKETYLDSNPMPNKVPKLADINFKSVVELYFVNDAQIREINAKYRGVDKATDVVSLSYLQHEDFPQDNVAGEIFISVDTAKKQAEEDYGPLRDELLFLFVHGVLHIFGYDHETEEDRIEMFSLHEKITLNIANKGTQC